MSVARLVFFLVLWFVAGMYLIPTFFKKAQKLMTDETLVVVSIGLCLGMVYLATSLGGKTMSDFTAGADGQYADADGNPVFFAWGAPLEYLGGYTLRDYWSAMDLDTFYAVDALMDADGMIPMTEETVEGVYSLTGGDYFGNYEGVLPADEEYHECDIDTLGAQKRGAKRLVYSDDAIYYTEDHYESFTLLYGEG